MNSHYIHSKFVYLYNSFIALLIGGIFDVKFIQAVLLQVFSILVPFLMNNYILPYIKKRKDVEK